MKNKIPHKLIQKAETIGDKSLITGRSMQKVPSIINRNFNVIRVITKD